jgi:hypothetical protein
LTSLIFAAILSKIILVRRTFVDTQTVAKLNTLYGKDRVDHEIVIVIVGERSKISENLWEKKLCHWFIKNVGIVQRPCDKKKLENLFLPNCPVSDTLGAHTLFKELLTLL